MASIAAKFSKSARYHLAASIATAIILPILFVGSVIFFSLNWIGPTLFWCLRLMMAVLAASIAFAYFQAGNKSKVPFWLAVALVMVVTLAIK